MIMAVIGLLLAIFGLSMLFTGGGKPSRDAAYRTEEDSRRYRLTYHDY